MTSVNPFPCLLYTDEEGAVFHTEDPWGMQGGVPSATLLLWTRDMDAGESEKPMLLRPEVWSGGLRTDTGEKRSNFLP